MSESTARPWFLTQYENYKGFSIHSETDSRFGCIAERWEKNAKESRIEAMQANAELIVTAVNERDVLLAENKRLREALEAIERWQLPPTEQFGPNGEPMSYGAAYGSNGERDYMRSVAREALKGKDSSMRRGETDADTHGLR